MSLSKPSCPPYASPVSNDKHNSSSSVWKLLRDWNKYLCISIYNLAILKVSAWWSFKMTGLWGLNSDDIKLWHKKALIAIWLSRKKTTVLKNADTMTQKMTLLSLTFRPILQKLGLVVTQGNKYITIRLWKVQLYKCRLPSAVVLSWFYCSSKSS